MNIMKVKRVSWGEAILYEIRQAKIQNKKIVKLGLPEAARLSFITYVPYPKQTKKNIKLQIANQLGMLYGIPVEDSKTLQITTAFSRFIPDK